MLLADYSYISLTSTLYTDVTLGIQDPDVFRTPAGCHIETGHDDRNGLSQVRRQTRRSVQSAGIKQSRARYG
jgi:hypothetical protein